jgi:hypothetical protein
MTEVFQEAAGIMKRCRINLLLIIVCGLLFIFPGKGRCEPNTVQACGMAQVMDGNLGRAETQALQDAQRNAVEMGLGTLIDSETIVNNAVLIQDRIYSRASGYVTDYHVTAKGLTPSGKAFETCIQATVDTADIKEDLRAIGILKQRVGNPRFMVVYLPRTDGAADAQSLVVKAAEGVLSDAFRQKGFIVIDRSLDKDFTRQMGPQRAADADFKDLSRVALTYQAELLLVFDVDASDRAEFSNPYFKEISLSLHVRSIASGTAELISSERRSTGIRTSRSMQQDYAESPLVAKSMTRLAQQVAEKTMEDTLAYFERRTNEGTLYTCRFKGFGQDEMIAIVDVIENMGGTKDKNVRVQSADQMQVDIYYLGKRFDLQRELTEGLENKGIALEIGAAGGNEFLFLKKE